MSHSGDAIDKGLAEAFGGGDERPPASSVLRALQARTDAVLGVHLDGGEPADTPVSETDETKRLRDPSGRYQVLGEIGRGGVGIVYKGRDADLGRDVAMKVLKDEYADHPEVLARFVEEAQIGGQLQHPGIVPVYELGLQAGERPYFAMKLVKGETLAAHLARRTSPTEERRRLLGVFEQVCQTMAYAHARRVVHRDLKPANVMIGAFGEVQVVDWGFAKVLPKGGTADEAESKMRATERSVIETVRSQSGSGSHSVAGSVLGTPAYMSPEQALGDVDHLDLRSDVFGLGAILCEILTGAPPYREADGDLVRQAAAGALEGALERLSRSGADESLVTLCTECLGRARRARPESAAEVAERVGAYLTSVEERARQADLRAAEARYRNRMTMVGSAAALVVVLLGAGAWIWRQGELQDRRAEAAQRVAKAMSEASGAHGRAREAGLDLTLWSAAESSVDRLVEAAVPEDVEQVAREEAEALHFAVEEESRAARTKAERIERDETMVARLETLRIPIDDDVRWHSWWLKESRRLDGEYAGAFAAYLDGADVLAQPTETSLASLRDGDIAEELAASLDHWVLVRDGLRDAEDAPDAAGTARIREVATLLDSKDAWRGRLRALLPNVEEEGVRLRALAEEAGSALLTAAGYRVLHVALWRAGEREAAVDALRRGQEAHPTDFDLCFRLAVSLERLDVPRWEEAVAAYRIAHALRPLHVEVLHRKGLVLMDQLDRFVEAERTFRRLVDRDPAEKHWLRHLAYAVDLQGRLDEALEIFEETLALDPDDDQTLKSIGSAFWRRGENEKAEEYFLRAIDRNPRNGEAHTNLGLVYKRWRRFQEAVKHSREAVEIDTGDYRFHANLGAVLAQSGEVDEALASYERALVLNPRDVMSLTNMGNAVRGSDAALAMERYERAIAIDPEYAPAHVGRGLVLWGQGRREEAKQAYRRAIQANSRVPAAHHNLALSLLREGDPEQAIAHHRAAVAAAPWDVTFRAGLAKALIDMGLFGEAESELREALGRVPDDPDCLIKLGLAVGRQGQLKEAETISRRVIEVLEGRRDAAGSLSPREREILRDGHGNLGVVLGRMNRLEEAIASHRRALEVDRDYPLEHNNLGSALWDAGQYEEALASYRRALELSPDSLVAQDNLATSLARLGRLDEAIPELRRLLEIDESYANGHLNLGLALRQVGDFAGALEAFETAERLYAEQEGEQARRRGEMASNEITTLRRIPAFEAILAGRRPAASSEEWAQAVDFAHHSRRYAEIVALTEETISTALELLGDESWHGYNSACAAALLAVETEGGEERTRVRELARTWLDGERARWDNWITEDAPRADEARRRLKRALEDTDFASVRADALSALPELERALWRELWSSIEAASKR